MNILNYKRLSRVFLVLLMFITATHIYAQEEIRQLSKGSSLEKVKNLLDEGFEYLQLNAFDQAKLKFEEAFKIAPEEIKGEIRNIIARSEEMASKKKLLTEETVIKGETESKRIAELKQNIIQFEKEQKKKAYMEKGKSYYDQGRYENAVVEFNKILEIDSNDKDAAIYIEKTNVAMKRAKKRENREEILAREKRVRECWENARNYYNNKQYDAAIEEIKKILAVNPTDTEAVEYMELMEEMKLFSGKLAEAEKLEDMVDKGKEYYRDREYDKAIEIWGQVLKEKEDYPGIKLLISQAEVIRIKGERVIKVEEGKIGREKKWLEIDEAYVPVVGSVKEEKERKSVEDEEELAIEEIRKKAKEKKVSLDFIDADLRTVIEFLSRQSNINMVVDENIFDTGETAGSAVGARASMGGGPGVTARPGPSYGSAAGLGSTPEIPVRAYNVTILLRDMPLLDTLSLLLRPRGLDYEIRPNVIWISTRDRIDNISLEALETRVFDLQFGGPIRGQLRPEPMELETITFGESGSSGD